MIRDFEQELTLAGGHRVNFAAGSQYGSRPYDMKAAAAGILDPAVGEPLDVFMQPIQDCSTLDSVAITLVADDDGAGTNEEVLVTKTFVLADLEAADGVRRVGRVAPGVINAASTTRRYLTAKLTVAGATGDGYITVWLDKASNAAPHNAGVVI